MLLTNTKYTILCSMKIWHYKLQENITIIHYCLLTRLPPKQSDKTKKNWEQEYLCTSVRTSCYTISFQSYHFPNRKQELSYHKQIAGQLRTQYTDDIYDNPVTLKSRLMVTQGQWKRNHWVDHTQLTIRRVIKCWILSRPWNMSQRSLKIIEAGAIRKLGCSFLFAFYSNCGRICSRLWDIQCQRMAWPWKPG